MTTPQLYILRFYLTAYWVVKDEDNMALKPELGFHIYIIRCNLHYFGKICCNHAGIRWFSQADYKFIDAILQYKNQSRMKLK